MQATFMETCLQAKTPPRSMCLWVEPHIYHITKETEREWRDTLVTALLATLIKHYSKVIEEETRALETTLREITTNQRKSARNDETKKWIEL